METKKSRDTIQSLKTGISIIDVIADKKRPLKFSEIQETTNITKSNLYKYLNTLMNDHLVYRDEETGFYHLGSRLIQYGMAAIGNQDTVAVVTPYLQAIAEKTNNTALFASPTVNGPIITKIIRSNQILNIGAEIGALLPPQSSSGKVFQLFAEKYKTKYWKTDYQSDILNENSEETVAIHKEKIAFAAEPLISEVSSVSIPILNQTDELIGIVTVVGFSRDIPKTPDEEQSLYLKKLQEELSKSFY